VLVTASFSWNVHFAGSALATDAERHSALYRCRACGTLYKVFPEERASPRAIDEDEVRQVFPDMNRQKLFQLNDLEIWKEGDRFFATYDAGSHQVIWRKDEITGEEAELARRAPMEMLFALQKRLSEAGIDPYIANFERD
jgi:hypothetical protein